MNADDVRAKLLEGLMRRKGMTNAPRPQIDSMLGGYR
jgi:hypothetical protein